MVAHHMFRRPARRVRLGAVLALGAMLYCVGPWARAAGYHLVRVVPLPQVTGWDYLKIDPQRRELFISNNSGVIVVDIDTFREVGTIPSPADWPGVGLVHGVAVSNRLGLGFISREIPPSVVTFRLSNLAIVRSTATDRGTDAIVYDPATERVFTFNGKYPGVHDVTAIAALTGRRLADIALPGVPEFPVADGRGHLFDNVSSVSKLARINTRSLKVTGLWPMGQCVHPSALAIDRLHRRVFAACQNRIMVMISTASGRVIGSVPIGAGTDSVRYDPGTGDVFAASGAGTLTVAREVTPGRLVLLQQLRTGPNGRSMALDRQTHRVFVMSAKFGAFDHFSAHYDRRNRLNPHGYPVVLRGTARLLVFGP